MIGLSILVPTLPGRQHFFGKIIQHLLHQCGLTESITGIRVEILTNDRTDISIGAKRNILLQQATGEYITFIDDDDRIADNYVACVVMGINNWPDCCSLNGIITTNGQDPKPFRHSIDYASMYEMDGVFYRPPNHLNAIRSSIAKQMVFPDWQRSEDSNYCFQLRDSGLLKVEHKIEPVLYYYDYISDKRY